MRGTPDGHRGRLGLKLENKKTQLFENILDVFYSLTQLRLSAERIDAGLLVWQEDSRHKLFCVYIDVCINFPNANSRRRFFNSCPSLRRPNRGSF